MDDEEEAAVKGTRPAYPTLLELIRGRIRRTAVAGGSAALIVSVGCSSVGGGSLSDVKDVHVNAGDDDVEWLAGIAPYDFGNLDQGGEDIYVLQEIFGGGMPVPDLGWKEEAVIVEETTDLPVEVDTYIPLAGDMEWEDVHEPADQDASNDQT